MIPCVTRNYLECLRLQYLWVSASLSTVADLIMEAFGRVGLHFDRCNFLKFGYILEIAIFEKYLHRTYCSPTVYQQQHVQYIVGNSTDAAPRKKSC